jgi:hypothetical protein
MSSNDLTPYSGGSLSTSYRGLDKQLAKQARRRVDEDMISAGLATQVSTHLQDLHDDQRSMLTRSAYAAHMTIEAFPEGRMKSHLEAILIGQLVSTALLMEDIKTSYERGGRDRISAAYYYDDRNAWQRFLGRK